MTLLAPGLSTQLHPSVTSRIPNELYDAVISHFHADKPSLTTCTLVCSSWLPRARHLLLTSARITRHARARSFLELISAPRNLGTFAPVIRSLEIYSSARVNPKAHVQHLPALRRVYVSCVARYFGPGKCLQIAEWGAWFRPRAIQLTDLALGHATLGELLEFVEMLPEFEALRHLALIGVNWLDASLPSNEAHGEMRFPDIRSLILSGQSIHLVPYLSAHGVSITKLDLRVGRHKSDEVLAREAEDIHQYMCLLAPNIQELDLHDGSYQGGELPSLPKLRTLWLHGIDLMSTDSWVIQILKRLAAPTLHILTLDGYLDNLVDLPSDIPPRSWITLQRVVADNPLLTQMKKIRVRWLPGDRWEEAEVRVSLSAVQGVECEVGTESLPCASTLEPYRVYGRWFESGPVE